MANLNKQETNMEDKIWCEERRKWWGSLK